MFWNKEYTTKGDKIIDNETGAELDINTNNLADKSGIKSDLVQGESPIEVEITPKKDVKEKFAKGFKKALMVGTVTLFTVGLIYGAPYARDVYKDYTEYYRDYKEKTSYNNYYNWENETIYYSLIPACKDKLLENNLTFDYSYIVASRNIQDSERFSELTNDRKNIVKDLEDICKVLYKYENLKNELFDIHDKKIKEENNGKSLYQCYINKIRKVCPDVRSIYDINPIEVEQVEFKIERIKSELSGISDVVNSYEEKNGIDLENKLEKEIKMCEEIIEEIHTEGYRMNNSLFSPVGKAFSNPDKITYMRISSEELEKEGKLSHKDESRNGEKNDSGVIVQELKPFEDCEGKKIQIKTENKDMEEFKINSIEDLENAPNVEEVKDLGDEKYEIEIKRPGVGELER